MLDSIVQRDAMKQVDRVCLRLFEHWCSDRKLVPLVYLLHCWPLAECKTVQLKRIADAMAELICLHEELIDPETLFILRTLIAYILEAI